MHCLRGAGPDARTKEVSIGMDIQLADQHIYRLDDRLTPEEIRQRAMDRRTGAFGGGLENLFSRPKADDIELIDSQRRLEPFWHVSGRAQYVYERSRDYAVVASAFLTCTSYDAHRAFEGTPAPYALTRRGQHQHGHPARRPAHLSAR